MAPRAILIVVALAALALPAGAAEAACPSLGLVAGASRPTVRGVVERSPIAANPFPWGSSISAVTRVWGGVTVERWATSSELRDCLEPDDFPTYEAVGIEEVLVPAGDTVSSLELAALQSQFGRPVEFEPSRFDRTMAWLRVFPSVPVVLVLVGWSVAAVRRRRHRPSDGYLF